MDGGAEPRSGKRTEGEIIVRFMFFVKAAEDQGPPPQALMDAMGPYIEKGMQAGNLVDTGGLAPSDMGTRVRVAGGKLTVLDGPFSETKEVIGGYAVMDFNSREEAVEAAKAFLELHATHWPEWEGESEIRQVFGPND
jgi:hypothetical protein